MRQSARGSERSPHATLRPAALAGAALVLAALSASAAEGVQRPRPPLKPGGYFTFVYDREGCRPAIEPRFYQIAVADLSVAQHGLAAAFAAAGASDLTPGCDVTARWDPGIVDATLTYGQSLWVPETGRAAFRRDLFALGSPQVDDEIGYQKRDGSLGPFHGIAPADLAEFERLKRELSANSADRMDPVERRVAEDRLRELAPRADVLRRTQGYEWTHVLLVQKAGAASAAAAREPRVVRPTVTRRPPPSAGAEEYRQSIAWSAPPGSVSEGVESLPGGSVNWGLPEATAFQSLFSSSQLLEFSRVGERQALHVTNLTYASGRYIGGWDVSGSDMGLSYSADHPGVAGVDPSGVVQARGNGLTMVKIIGWGQIYNCFVQVNLGSELRSMRLQGPIYFRFKGDNSRPRVEGQFSNGNKGEITGYKDMQFSVDQTSVAALGPTGLLYALASGSTVLRARYQQMTATMTVTVDIRPANAMNRLAIGPEGPVLRQPGDKIALFVTGTAGSGQTSNLTSSITGTRYRSSAPSVISVSREGVAQAHGPGTAVITAENGALIASVVIQSRPARLKSMEIVPNSGKITRVPAVQSTGLPAVTTLRLRVIGHFSDGSTGDIALPDLGTRYESSDPKAVPVTKDGVVLAVETGSATIRVSNHGIRAQATFRVNRFSPTPLPPLLGRGYKDVAVSADGRFAYVAAGLKGWYLAVLKKEAAPEIVAAYPTRGSVVEIAITGATLDVIGDRGVDSYEIDKTIPQPRHLESLSVSGIKSAVAHEGLLYVAVNNRLEIYDARSLKRLGRTRGSSRGIAALVISGGRAFETAGASLSVFDVSVSSRPHQIKTITLPGRAAGIAASGHRVFAAIDGADHPYVGIIDVDNPVEVQRFSPRLGAGIELLPRGMSINKDWLLITGASASGNDSLMIVDISQPRVPFVVGTVRYPEHFTGKSVLMVGHRAFVLADGPDGAGLHIASLDRRYDKE